MLIQLGIAFVAGLITAVSPCVLPVLPVVLAGGASGSRRRPYAIIAGLLSSFLVSILFAAWILDRLGLPQDLLREISIGLLFLVAITLLFPQVGALIERPLSRLARGPSSDLGGGFLLGCALGFVFVPCGGPVLAYITSSVAASDFGFTTVALAVAYALGASLVLLAIAVGGSRASGWIRTRVDRLRIVLGLVVAAAAFALVFNVDTELQTRLPNWTDFLQQHTEQSAAGRFQRQENVTQRKRVLMNAPGLPDYGPAPPFTQISHWLNTQGARPLTMKELRGRVVLVDFWTYSCINCLRTLPYVEAWDRTYRKEGLTIVGVHTPEFAFEHDLSNVRSNARDLGVRYPIALDNDFGTWNAYGNQYWPAKYLIDRRGHVRFAHFGEGDYEHTESLIRKLLAEPDLSLPKPTQVSAYAPEGTLTPETYLGWQRISIRYQGTPIAADRVAQYDFPPAFDGDGFAYAGTWRVEKERIVAGPRAQLRIRFYARRAHLVLGGRGTVDVLLEGKSERRIRVTEDRLYTLVDQGRNREALLELRFSPGVSAYAFTFG
jgi:cytochrome c biogenesis protein CcdA/thiol-disulfide isomerase/thioredoxin